MELWGERGENKSRRPRLFNYLKERLYSKIAPTRVLLSVFQEEDGFAAKVVVC